ncbi:isochorismatase family cysteine hydrolase [uncultured Endozoicomonas sp.]|uniref:isochorismatase family cysteine hydrolase n=1 Tax=uncultured Endozoicomonas sp. TaxID=432652 RepID=UPI0026104D71|nr:isochorismatase family cysteine hydrolase [uncultured Endozoicomonas sp.]
MSSALVVVDLINDLIHPDGKRPAYAKQVADHQVLNHANNAIAVARKLEWTVIFVRVGFATGYQDLPSNSSFFGSLPETGALRMGRWGTEFHEALNVQAGDLIVQKPRINPFYGTNLDPILRAGKVSDVFLCGVSTTWAVQSAARSAHDMDYRVFVVSDACTDATEEDHVQSIGMLSHLTTLCSSEGLESVV